MQLELSPERQMLLDEVASRYNRSKAQIVCDALDAYLEHERWFSEAVEQGRQEAREGDLIDHEVVVRRMENRYKR